MNEEVGKSIEIRFKLNGENGEVDELAAENDKETALELARKYLQKMNVDKQDMGKMVHLYRDAIISDMRNQIEAHIHEDTKYLSIKVGIIKGWQL